MENKCIENSQLPPDPPPPVASATRPHGEITALLVEQGFLTDEQVGYVTRIQSKLSNAKPILDVIKELELVTDEQIRGVIRSNISVIRIGDLLTELGFISSEDLQVALEMQNKETPPKKLGEVLIEHNFLEERKLIEVLSLQLGFACIEPEFTAIDRALFSKGALATYKTHNFIPIRVEENETLIAFADPLDHNVIDQARNIFGPSINPAIASRRSIHKAIMKIKPEKDNQRLHACGKDSTVSVVNGIIAAAINSGSVSDIHIEPMADRLRVRFRKDGAHLFRL